MGLAAISSTLERPLRVLTFSSLFPNAAQPLNGVFVENRLRHLVASGQVAARVVAPVPWFPSANPRFGAWARFAGAPSFEERHGIKVWHPRFPVIPKVGMTLGPLLMYFWTRGLVRKLQADADFDLIDAHYFYPDGVAAALIARDLGKPLVITARGTDINLIPQFALPKAQIRWAAGRADGLVTVCDALRDALLDLDVSPDKVRVLRNGVDLVSFCPRDREEVRARLGLSGRILASVGHLIERKGHHLIIDALRQLPDFTLLIAGGGPDRQDLESRAMKAGVGDRVRFLGEIPHEVLPDIYSAADALVLASSREGWANVLLESMACGTPVVASDVWGTREVVGDGEAGVLVEDRSADGIANGVRALFAALPDRSTTRSYAEQFSWDATTEGQLALFNRIVADRNDHLPTIETIDGAAFQSRR
ncbi:glycosyltransferase family 4 protein [Telmatospirillum sp.]|uniref:glycosyltransferase family 4 protein n=1 Tax=Telmatospirillum sp. TaxID=2079197 RepID=UPI002849E519|nr:glycosyltransferase family 4 protein [Telmatospirillum sp.]MDR3437879.1 glycosyltransferase family 4 protein [Telmatospirillum sp.]